MSAPKKKRKKKPEEPITPEVAEGARQVVERHNEIIKKYRIAVEPVVLSKSLYRMRAFRDFVRWCFSHTFDPADYFEALYTLTAPEMPQQLRDMRARDEYEKLRAYKALRDGPKGILANRELSICAITPAQEAVRRNAILGPAGALTCFLQKDPLGLYDPRSQWCAQCQLMMQCAIKINQALGRDVVALRRTSRR